ncbi:MAG: hypothetical protein ACREAA_17910 [Candidatus Polarisedimenticolia bacterium]
MTAVTAPTLSRVLRRAALVLSGAFIALYLVVALARVAFPYELEWMEGGAVDHVRRLLAGQPLYVKPSLEFIPYIYPPLYFEVCAMVGRATGAGFASMRAVSLAASLGCFVLLFLIVCRETGSKAAGLLSAGLFAATYRMSGAWLDLARVDSLFLMLTLASAYVLRGGGSLWRCAAAGALMTLSFLTKQPAAIVALALALHEILCRRGLARFAFLGSFVALSVAGTALLDARSGGWFAYYVLDLPRQHTLESSMFLGFWIHDLGRHLPIAAGMAAVWLVTDWRDRKASALFMASLAAGMVAASWTGRVHTGGYDNVLLPACAGLALLFGVSAHSLARPAHERSHGRAALVSLLCSIQLLVLAYDPIAQIPTRADVDAGDRLVQLMRQLPGDIFLPMHGYLPALAGKPTWAQAQAIDDVSRGTNQKLIDELDAQLTQAIEGGRFGAIILDGMGWPFHEEMKRRYEARGPLWRDPGVLMPRTGLKTRPEELYLLREAASLR